MNELEFKKIKRIQRRIELDRDKIRRLKMGFTDGEIELKSGGGRGALIAPRHYVYSPLGKNPNLEFITTKIRIKCLKP